MNPSQRRPARTDCQPTPQSHVLVGIDISKHRHEVLIAVLSKKRRRRLTIQNKREDFERLVSILQGFQTPVCVGFEATGNYHRNLAYALHKAGCDLKLISSVALARSREALHNSWDKNDPKDAQVILHMLQIQNPRDCFKSEGRWVECRVSIGDAVFFALPQKGVDCGIC